MKKKIRYFVNPQEESDRLERIALLAEHLTQERSEARSLHAYIQSALDTLKDAAKHQKKISLTLSTLPGKEMLEQIKTNPVIHSVECQNLRAEEQSQILEAVNENTEIVALSFQHCILSIEAKNSISSILRNRTVKKFGLIDCRLDNWDYLWLKDALKNLSGVEALSIVDDIEPEDFKELLADYPMVNCRMVGVRYEHMLLVREKILETNRVYALEVFHPKPLDHDSIEKIFEMVSSCKITGLSLPNFKAADETAYKKFISLLKTHPLLETLKIQYCSGLENDIFATLVSQNSHVESVHLLNSERADKTKLDRIYTLTQRNQIMNTARAFLGDCRIADQPEEDYESLAGEASKHLQALLEVSDSTYVSATQDTIKSLIQDLETLRNALQPQSPVQSPSGSRTRRGRLRQLFRSFG